MARYAKRTDGRCETTFRVDGKQYHVYARTGKDLREKIQQKREEIKQQSFTLGKDLTVAEYAERWITYKSDVKSTTIRSHKIIVKRLSECVYDDAGHRFGDLKLTEVEPNHVREVQRRLDEGGLHTSTTNATINEIRSIFKSAVTDRIVVFNPASGIKRLKRREEECRDTIHRALTDAEIKKFFEAARDEWYYDLFCLLYSTGMRCGEACALRYSDVKDNQITVKRSITRQEDGSYIVGKDAKTKKSIRTIPLNDGAREALERQKRYNIQSQGASVFEGEHLYFHNARGGIADSAHVSQSVRRICKIAEIEPFGVHAFRDTFASRAVASGMHPKVLQEVLGHSDIQMTMNLYTHVYDEQKADEMNNINLAI